jgi:hypothetical protein
VGTALYRKICNITGQYLFMELPPAQFKRHRLAYSIAAVIGLAAFVAGCFLLRGQGASLVFAGIFIPIGLVAAIYCSRSAMNDSVVLEFNREGIRYKKEKYAWTTLRSYAIRKETGEGGSFEYLILNFKGPEPSMEIQLDWLEQQELVAVHMATYAAAFHIGFEGITRKGT